VSASAVGIYKARPTIRDKDIRIDLTQNFVELVTFIFVSLRGAIWPDSLFVPTALSTTFGALQFDDLADSDC